MWTLNTFAGRDFKNKLVAEKCNEMIVYIFIITLKQFSSKNGNGFFQDDTHQVVGEEAEDLDDPGVAANELLEEVGESEDDVLGDSESDLESTIKASADSMEVDSEKHKKIM